MPKTKDINQKDVDPPLWAGVLLSLFSLVLAVTVGLLIAFKIQRNSHDWLGPVLIGAVCGLVAACLLWYAIAQINILLHGGFLHIGDRVKIIKGPHKGKTGTILTMDAEKNHYEITLENEPDQSNVNYFAWLEMRKIK